MSDLAIDQGNATVLHGETEVWASNTLSRPALIELNGSEELLECFKYNHYTIKELLDSLTATVAEINREGLTDANLSRLNMLSREGQCWNVDEEEVVRA